MVTVMKHPSALTTIKVDLYMTIRNQSIACRRDGIVEEDAQIVVFVKLVKEIMDKYLSYLLIYLFKDIITMS